MHTPSQQRSISSKVIIRYHRIINIHITPNRHDIFPLILRLFIYILLLMQNWKK